MVDVIEKNPDDFNVVGNIAPVEVSAPVSTDVFTKDHCTLSLESAVVVDGVLLIPVKSTAAW